MDHSFKKNPMNNFAMLTSHEQLVETVLHICVSERFIKDLWKYLWTNRKSRWTTGGPPGPSWQSL